MGQERAAILDLDEHGNITLPIQFKAKLKLSRKVFVSLFIDGNGNRHKMTVNRNENNKYNIRDIRTNKIRQFDFSSGVIPVEQFISDAMSSQVVVWFDDENKELVFQCVFSE